MKTMRATSWALAAALAVGTAAAARAQESQASDARPPAPEAPVVTQDPPAQTGNPLTPPALTIGVLPPPPAPGTVTGGQSQGNTGGQPQVTSGGQEQSSVGGQNGQPQAEPRERREEHRHEWFRRMERRYELWRDEKRAAMSEVWQAVRHDEGSVAKNETSGGSAQRKATNPSPAPNTPAPSNPALATPVVQHQTTPVAPRTDVRHDPSQNQARRDAPVVRRNDAPVRYEVRREEHREFGREARREDRREIRHEERQQHAQNRGYQSRQPNSVARR